MNYLAHAYLSFNDPQILFGNIIGDYIKGDLKHSAYNLQITKGLSLHRKIDSYSDQHPLSSASRNLIQTHRRFARIILDVFNDHFLAKNWIDYTNQPLADFAQKTYQVLKQNQHLLPEDSLWLIEKMIKEDWLTGYSKIENIKKALQRISYRFYNKYALADAIQDLNQYYESLESNFKIMFNDLINHLKNSDIF